MQTDFCCQIAPLDRSLAPTAQAHLDSLTKPRGSLGRIEDLATRVYCIQKGNTPLRMDKAVLFTVAGDHGVAAEGVSPYPQEVTRQMVMNFLQGGAAINILCRANNIDLHVVDAGCVGGAFAPHPMLIDVRVGDGTANLMRAPAMSTQQCTQALHHGMDIAAQAAQNGYTCIGVGEMGIANTTAATALYCALLHLTPEAITGPGCGASPDMVQHKISVIASALQRYAQTTEHTPFTCLRELGGFEIAVMAGLILGGAQHGIVVLIDGFISTAAFMVARALCPAAEDYCILTHASAEPGFAQILQAAQVSTPLLHLGLRLGEGTGAALAYPLVRAAACIYNEMATLQQAGVSDKA